MTEGSDFDGCIAARGDGQVNKLFHVTLVLNGAAAQSFEGRHPRKKNFRHRRR
jgi:hypothetical protein